VEEYEPARQASASIGPAFADMQSEYRLVSESGCLGLLKLPFTIAKFQRKEEVVGLPVLPRSEMGSL
jgi:hypothetical protein